MSAPLSGFLPVVAVWFRQHVGTPTAPQIAAWPAIQRGENVHIHSPTGTGKTFAAFLWAINDLVARPPAARSGVRVLYVSPLKALNNDIERNLSAPLAGIAEAARVRAQVIRTAVRTGDTTPSRREQNAYSISKFGIEIRGRFPGEFARFQTWQRSLAKPQADKHHLIVSPKPTPRLRNLEDLAAG